MKHHGMGFVVNYVNVGNAADDNARALAGTPHQSKAALSDMSRAIRRNKGVFSASSFNEAFAKSRTVKID